MIKLAMFDTKEYDIESFNQYLKDKKDISIKYFEPKLNKDTVSLAKGFDAVIVFVNDEIDQDVIVNLLAHNVKALFLRCAGYNNVDLEYANNKLPIYRVPAYSPYAVAEFAFALLQTSNRRIHKAYNRIREYNFSLSNLVGHDLHNKTIGIIGFGRIRERVQEFISESFAAGHL